MKKLLWGAALLALLVGGRAVPAAPIAGVDWRTLPVDGTGTALGTAANPLITGVGGGGSSVFPAAAALADSTANPTLSMIQTFPMCWNSTGSNWNRLMGITPFLTGLTPSSGGAGLIGAAGIVYDATSDSLNVQRSLHSFADGISGGATVGVGPLVWNGTGWDRARTAGAATGTTGTGLLGVGNLLFDSVGNTNFVKQAGDGSGRAMVVGAAAAGAAVAGNPLPVALSDPSGNAQYWKQALNSTGSITNGVGVPAMGLYVSNGGTSWTPIATGGSIADATTAVLALPTAQWIYNGATFDRTRNNLDGVLQASTATGVGTINYDITNYNGRFLIIHANVTSYGAAGSVTLSVQMKDANGLFVQLPNATTGAVTTGADITLQVGPNSWPANASPNFYANNVLPRTIRIVQTIAGNTVTLSDAYSIQMS